MNAILRAVPLLLLPALLYGAVAVTMPVDAVRASLAQPLYLDYLPSGALFEVSRGYGFIVFAAAMLFIEVVKSTRAGASSLAESVLAFLCFSVALGLFLLHASFGTAEWAMLTLMMLLDFMSGVVVMAMVARRDTHVTA